MSDKKNIRLKPLIAIVCDDVRQENNGKPFIIGIYTSDMVIEAPDIELPDHARAAMPLSLWVAFDANEQAGLATVEFEVQGPNPKHKLQIKAKLDLETAPRPYEQIHFHFAGFPVRVDSEGELKVSFRHEGDSEWETLRTLPVKHKKSAQTLAIPSTGT